LFAHENFSGRNGYSGDKDNAVKGKSTAGEASYWRLRNVRERMNGVYRTPAQTR